MSVVLDGGSTCKRLQELDQRVLLAVGQALERRALFERLARVRQHRLRASS